MPQGLTEASSLFLEIIRDADKLDIMAQVRDAMKNKRLHLYRELMGSIDPDGPATPALVEEILETNAGSYQHLHSLADLCLVMSAWVFDLNLIPSLKRCMDRGLFQGLIKPLPDTPQIKRIVEREKRSVAERIPP
jgi:hypothetical protein